MARTPSPCTGRRPLGEEVVLGVDRHRDVHAAAVLARTFKLAKDSAVKARTQAVNQLKAALVTADPALRDELSGL